MRGFFILILLFSSVLAQGQYDHIAVLPNLEGNELFTALITDFTPDQVNDYSTTRDIMFSEVDLKNDSVECIYSGFTKYLDPSEDPSTFLYGDGGDLSINTEHSYPQSKGAEFGSAKSDIHHLFPSRAVVNSARGSEPFGEINDQETIRWYLNTQVLTNTPNQNIDAYSEDTNERFEPRESVKGDIARAIFYFYTIYRAEAEIADANFFNLQKDNLCAWHNEDPVDEKEWNRTFAIAQHQGNTNPFVLDCTLASRIYCDGPTAMCKTLGFDESRNNQLAKQVKIYPNPNQGTYQLEVDFEQRSNLNLRILDLGGKLVFHQFYEDMLGHQLIELDLKLSSGMYLQELEVIDNEGIKFLTNKLILK